MPLFDGNTLAGWTTTGGRYDGKAVWTVEDSSLVGRTGEGQAGGLIYTERMYSSFELAMQVWIDHPFDSGVFTNMLKYNPTFPVREDMNEDGVIKLAAGKKRHALIRAE